jgi:hypothetical protein
MSEENGQPQVGTSEDREELSMAERLVFVELGLEKAIRLALLAAAMAATTALLVLLVRREMRR